MDQQRSVGLRGSQPIDIDIASLLPPPPPPAWYPDAPLPCYGYATRGAYSEALGMYQLAAYASDSFGCVLIWSNDGLDWTSGVKAGGSPFDVDYTNPFTASGNYGRCYDVAWSPSLGLFVAVGGNGVAGNTSNLYAICTSADGKNWTRQGNPFTATSPFTKDGLSVAWSEEQGLFVVGGSNNGGHAHIATSPDGTTWTTHTTPLDTSGRSGDIVAIAYSPDLDLWVVGSNNIAGTGAKGIMTSPDGATWTLRSSPLDTFTAGPINVSWSPTLGLFIAVAGTLDPVTSPDGITWTSRQISASDPFTAVGVDEYLGNIYVGGKNADSTITMYVSSDTITWTPYASPYDDPGAGGNAEIFDIVADPVGGILTVGQDAALNPYLAVYY
jgi:hypothetical protein